jgi:hypothetical protein
LLSIRFVLTEDQVADGFTKPKKSSLTWSGFVNPTCFWNYSETIST